MKSKILGNVQRVFVLFVLLREVWRVMGIWTNRSVVLLRCPELGHDYRIMPAAVTVTIDDDSQEIRNTCPVCGLAHHVNVTPIVAHMILEAGGVLGVDLPDFYNG